MNQPSTQQNLFFVFSHHLFHLVFTLPLKKNKGGKIYISHTRTRQCHCCSNYFIKSPEKMQKHLSVCAGKAGFTFNFDNGKIIDHQDHYKNLGDVPFSVYYHFETTTGSVVFFDAKMYVISYCIVIAFHPDLKFPRLIIYRSYEQSTKKSTSLSHFEATEHNFFKNKKNCNMTTLKQLQDAAFSVENREKNTLLAEMFSIELKFAVDCLKFWFNRNHKVLELQLEDTLIFKQENPKKGTICCLCDFPLDSRAENGWSQNAFKAEYLFLDNFYSKKEIIKMGIDNFEVYCEKLNKILDDLDSFCASIESENLSSRKTKEEDIEINAIVEKIGKIKTLFLFFIFFSINVQSYNI